jgi:hypothetical protein
MSGRPSEIDFIDQVVWIEIADVPPKYTVPRAAVAFFACILIVEGTETVSRQFITTWVMWLAVTER